jgi:hypothetical protein
MTDWEARTGNTCARCLSLARLRETRAAEVAVERLNAIEGGDPEGAHGEADQVLLALVPAEVREAYRALVARCEWWAAA